MSKFLKRHALSIIFAVASVALMFAAWAIAYKAEGNDLVVPPLKNTFSVFFSLFTEQFFWKSLGKTALRTLCAVAISLCLAAVCAVLVVLYHPFKAFFAPVVAVFRVVPTMAVTLILILAFPRGVIPVIVTMLVIFPMLYSQIASAIDGVDTGLLQMARVYKLTKHKTLFNIIIPQVAPPIISRLGTTLSFALKLTISAEVIASAVTGLGGMMQTANFWIEIPRLAALTLVSVILGLLVELVFFIVDRFTFKWRCRDGN